MSFVRRSWSPMCVGGDHAPIISIGPAFEKGAIVNDCLLLGGHRC